MVQSVRFMNLKGLYLSHNRMLVLTDREAGKKWLFRGPKLGQSKVMSL